MDKSKVLPEDLREVALVELLELYLEAHTGDEELISETINRGNILDMIAEIEQICKHHYKPIKQWKTGQTK